MFENSADRQPETVPGDLKFIIKVSEHSSFKRRGDNLYLKQSLTLVESLIGFEHEINHMDDSVIKLKREGVTPPGTLNISNTY